MNTEQIEKKLSDLGLALPTLPGSKGVYKSCLVVGQLLYVSGHISVTQEGKYITGKLGKDVSEEEGKAAARQCGLAILTSIKKELGSLDKVNLRLQGSRCNQCDCCPSRFQDVYSRMAGHLPAPFHPVLP